MNTDPDRRQASNLRISSEGDGSVITYQMAVRPLSIYKRQPSLGIVIRATPGEGDQVVPLSIGFMRWEG